LLGGAICSPILTAAISALSLESEPPLLATLHFLRDLLSYGTDNPASSSLSPGQSAAAAQANKEAVLALVRNQGEDLIQRLLTGMMFSFPGGCLQDASGAVLGLYQLAPQATTTWLAQTIDLLPAGTVKGGEKDKLLRTIGEVGRSQQGSLSSQSGAELRRVRALVADFTAGYRRRNVMPREGLGRLEPSRFRYTGS
jgi:transportin-3